MQERNLLDRRYSMRTVLLWFAIAFIALLSVVVVSAQTNTGHIAKVFDGDTVSFRKSNGRYYRVRLQGIDAPETRQTYGVECKALLDDITRGKSVTVMFYGSDSYKRMLGVLSTVAIPNINKFLIEEGCAWEYSAPLSLKTEYQNAEQTARSTNRGLWLDACPTEPWSFRASGYNVCP